MKELRVMHVVLETSFLSKVSFKQDSDWQKILLHSTRGHIKLHAARISLEEWRTRKRDRLFAVASRARIAIQNLEEEWNSNLVSQSIGELIVSSAHVPDFDGFDNESNEYIDDFVNTNKVNILEIKPDHSDQTWKKFFKWLPPFRHNDSPDDKQIRIARRKDIPDAWIIEAILDLSEENEDIYCLCDDGKLSETLNGYGVRTFKTAEEYWNYFNNISTQSIETKDSSQNIDGTLTAENNDDDNYEALYKIVGYAAWYAPIHKDELNKFMTSDGYQIQEINNGIDVLQKLGIIIDTGTHFTSKDCDFSKIAKERMKPIILEQIKSE